MNQNISKKTNVIIKEINSWKNDISNKLKDNIFKNEVFFLVNNHWLNEYEKCISKFDDQELKIHKYDDVFKLNNYTNNKVLDSLKLDIPIEKLPKLFILNKNVWDFIHNINEELISISSIGYCVNNLMTLKVCNNIYCFFFLDKKLQIRQGYLKIIKLENENKILNDFKITGIFKFINKDINDINNDFLLIEDKEYKLYITEYNESEEKMKNIFNTKLKLFANNKKIEEKISQADSRKIINEKMKKFKQIPKVVKVFKQINDLSKKNENEKEKDIDNMKVELRARRSFNTDKIETTNEKYNNIFFKKKEINITSFKPLENFIPGLIGLLNTGSICYLNSILQCFSNIRGFRKLFLNKEIYNDLKENKKAKKLSFALSEVLNNLWENLKQNYYSPEEFEKLICEMNPLFKDVKASNPKDLILFLLIKMHKELNISQTNPSNNVKNIAPNPSNFNDVYDDFIKFYFSKNKSIISDEFYGLSNNIITCRYCSNIIHNIQVTKILSMPLEEVRKFMANKNKIINCLRIDDYFEYYEKTDILPNYYCNYCRTTNQVYKKNKMIFAPKNLIINLNNGGKIKFYVNIKLEEYLDIKKFVFSPDSPFYYELTGAICHLDSNDKGGHFIAFCKNCNNCEWYKFDDKIVTKSSFNDISKSGIPYVLFYSYIQVI